MMPRKYSNEQLIAQVQMLAKELRKTPVEREFNREPRTVTVLTAINRFGSWNNLVEIAGFKPNRRTRT